MTISRDGFVVFIRTSMGISSSILPDNSPAIDMAYGVAVETVNCWFNTVAPTVYSQMVYNFAGDYLINWTLDTSPSTYFADLRTKYGINSFVAGVIQNTYDEGTGEGLMVPDMLKSLSLADLLELNTPYGRYYLAQAQKYGNLWGIS